ncbi:MAG TPA: alpha/beta fold hydrolase [Gemmatimonadales bacterium]|nr:alpha/beta fold hydrolase [Gemmatimonadales bacterium]MCB9519077.1 alpha/beta fold hydrolase [Gemmatimonadales bacterium]HPF62728.1 alpha/beta fold hydrolase [Gemmatimonadales bacterium]HRX18507.1 alpha/beta fold hydrolase [Gemmatimonadales bacterium]
MHATPPPTPSHPLTAADPRARVAGRTVRALATVSTAVAARAAEALFCRTVRKAPRAEEAAFLARAERFTIPVLRQRVVGYRWGSSGGPRVILVHGWWSHAGRFATLADAAVTHGAEVIAFDAPGHGGSSGWRASMPEFARTLRAIAETVGPVDAVVGHSLGGAAALFSMTRGLRVRRAVTIASPADVTGWADLFRDALDLPAPVDARMRRNLERRLALSWDELDVPSQLPRLDVPGLVVHDADDPDIAIAEGERLARAWPGARFLRTSGLGHRAVLRDPAVVREVLAFALAR